MVLCHDSRGGDGRTVAPLAGRAIHDLLGVVGLVTVHPADDDRIILVRSARRICSQITGMPAAVRFFNCASVGPFQSAT